MFSRALRRTLQTGSSARRAFSGDLKLAGGIATKLESGQSVRAVVCSAGHISASLKTTVADGLDLTACAQVHKDMKYKYGLQFAMKT